MKSILKRLVTLLLVCMTLLSLSSCQSKEKQITNVRDLDGKIVAAQIGTTHAALLKESDDFANSNILYATSIPNELAFLLGKKADAIIVDNVSAQTFLRKFDGLYLLDQKLDTEYYGFAFQKNSELVTLFNNELLKLKSQGIVNELSEKWFKEDISQNTVLQENWPGKNGTLRCKINSDFEPICFKDENGKATGFDIDLILHIAKNLDYKVTFVEDEFANLIPALTLGQCDLAASGITINDERKESVDFSEQYLDASAVILVRDVNVKTKGIGLILSIKNSLRRFFIDENRYKELLYGFGVSLSLILIVFVVGLVLGFLLYLWSYSGSKIANILLSKLARILSLLPVSTCLYISFYIIFAKSRVSSYFVAAFALSILFGISIWGDLSSAIGTISVGQKEAAFAMGYGKFRALIKLYIPQSITKFIGSVQGEVIGLVKNTSLVELIAVTDIQLITDGIRAQTMEPFIPIVFTALFFTLFGALFSWLVGLLKEKVNPMGKDEQQIKERIMKGKL